MVTWAVNQKVSPKREQAGGCWLAAPRNASSSRTGPWALGLGRGMRARPGQGRSEQGEASNVAAKRRGKNAFCCNLLVKLKRGGKNAFLL